MYQNFDWAAYASRSVQKAVFCTSPLSRELRALMYVLFFFLTAEFRIGYVANFAQRRVPKRLALPTAY